MGMTMMMRKLEQQSHQEIQKPQLKTQEIKKQETVQHSHLELLKLHQCQKWDCQRMRLLVNFFSLSHKHLNEHTSTNKQTF